VGRKRRTGARQLRSAHARIQSADGSRVVSLLRMSAGVRRG
jgi:hypothetical protein